MSEGLAAIAALGASVDGLEPRMERRVRNMA
jgi:hypothetical protein